MYKFFLLFNTIKFLKPIQVYYRLFYFFRQKIRNFYGFRYSYSKQSEVSKLVFQESIPQFTSYLKHNKFSFLNFSHDFGDTIDWNHDAYGKLWTYNLNYFDFLNQTTITNGENLIESFIESQEAISTGFEPFPIALRGINWVKYLSRNSITNQNINDNLYAQYYRLDDNLEYHLLGNHLLENGFSLLFGAYYFKDDYLYEKAEKILLQELTEQILDDGGHFELSPMYHQIMLFRLLDCINLVQNNAWRGESVLTFLREKASLMLGWLDQITYQNGEIPLLNDSAIGIAPSTNELLLYSERLSLKPLNIVLKESGYRKFTNDNYEVVIDVGEVGASYIPGHAHSDTFNFEVYKYGKPFIVDTGLSTYETNERRMIERSTSSHNTVEVNGQNQTEVWGGFRVGNRASIVSLIEENNRVLGSHNGYKKQNILHIREWVFDKDSIIIKDKINKNIDSTAFIHFHPTITKNEIEETIIVDEESVELLKYEYAKGFNSLEKAWCMKIKFKNKLITKINI